jgi:hypothetical protein
MNTSTWIAHFERNRKNRPVPDWGAPFYLPEEVRRPLARSLAEYQLGDGGGDCRLVAGDAEAFRGSEADMDRLVDLWFAEEAEHSRLLSHAVRRVGGTFITDAPAMRLFYAIRRNLGVQFELTVLLIVEIVSTSYYRAIRRHVADKPLADMCRLIIRDESGHIAFHRARIAARHPQGPQPAWTLRFYVLGLACATFLWAGKNGAALRALGTTRAEFFRSVFAGLRRFKESIARPAPAPRGAPVRTGDL